MGASQSKGESEPMVFVNEENPVPVRVMQHLIFSTSRGSRRKKTELIRIVTQGSTESTHHHLIRRHIHTHPIPLKYLNYLGLFIIRQPDLTLSGTFFIWTPAYPVPEEYI